MSDVPLNAQDVRAAAEVHSDLGPDYSDAVVQSFLEKIDKHIEARVDERGRRIGCCWPAVDVYRRQRAEQIDWSWRTARRDLGSTNGDLRAGRLPAASALARSPSADTAGTGSTS